jgi:hypothetical protein
MLHETRGSEDTAWVVKGYGLFELLSEVTATLVVLDRLAVAWNSRVPNASWQASMDLSNCHIYDLREKEGRY